MTANPVTADPARPDLGRGPLRPDPRVSLAQLFRDLRTSPGGLSGREAARRLEVTGPNELRRRGGRRWPGSSRASSPTRSRCCWPWPRSWPGSAARRGSALAIIAVIVLNAAFSFAQELQAERAVEALAAFLPERAHGYCATARRRTSRPGC